MKNIWFTSDLHFDHRNICKFTNRPWVQEDNTSSIVDRWNARVGVEDDVYHLGDFTFDGHKRFDKVVNLIKHLNGNIHFIRGNHCEPALWQMIEDARIAHVAWVKDYAEIRHDDQKIILCHFPFQVWNMQQHGAYHLHGHCHGSLPAVGKRLDVGLDNHPDHQIFSWQEVRDHMAKQDIVVHDHHTGERK